MIKKRLNKKTMDAGCLMNQKCVVSRRTVSLSAGAQLLGGLALLTWTQAVLAQTGTQVAAASFNSDFLRGAAKDMDVSRYAQGNPTLAGDYYLDVYVNGSWKGRNELAFRAAPGEINAHTCFTLSMLSGYGVDVSTIEGVGDALSDECRSLEGWLPGAQARFDSSNMRLDISIPQANMRRSARGYVDPAFWDPGINAGFLSYNFNALRTETHYGGNDSTYDNAYLMLNSGINIGAWQLRHDSNVSRRDGQGTDWQNTATYLRRPIPSIRGMVTVGDAYTEGNLFDSMGFRGARLASDDRMLPDSLRGYAPTVRGVAESNAVVEVRQNGQVIYQATVPPGPFVIDDLYPTGYGGDLEVTVTEADGRIRRFSLPFASVPQMLRPGISRYSVTAGKVRETSLDDDPWLMQATYQKGLTNRLTGYTGATFSDDYQAYLAGVAVGTPVGAFSADVTHARTGFDRYGDRNGQSYKLGYSKFMPDTGTNVTVAAYRYSTSGYLGLRDAIIAHDYEDRQLGFDAVRRQRSEFQLTVNQTLGAGLGAMYFTGSVRDYWKSEGETTQYQVGYNNNYGPFHYGFSALKTEDEFGYDDTQYNFNFSVPLDNVAGNASLIGSGTMRDSAYESSRLGVSGSAGVDGNMTYNVAVSHQDQSGATGELSGEYRAPYATLRASYSHNDNFTQMGAGVSGSMVAHSGGVTLTPQRGETMVLVEAPAAAGARVTNMSGVRIDKRGYAVVPYVSPYRLNSVTLDPNDMSTEVELKTSSQQVAPYAGAVAKLTFDTVSGQALLIKAKRVDGEPVPFGAEVYDEAGQPVGLVGQSGRVYLRTEKESGRLSVKWGEEANQSCDIDYRVPESDQDASAARAYHHLEARCE